MSNYEEEDKTPSESVADDITSHLKDGGNKTGNQIKGKVKEQAKKQVRKVTAKAVKKAAGMIMKTLGKAVAAVAAKFGLALLAILGVILVIIACWFIIREFKGAEGQYVNESPALNDFKQGEVRGLAFMQQAGLTGYNKSVFDYYNNITNNNYWIIDPEDPDQPNLSKYGEDDEDMPLYKMTTPQNSAIRDYYSREGDLVTNANLLYAMELYLHKEKFYFTQQFTKPVYYNPKTMKLKYLTKKHEDGKELIAKSRDWDEEKQKFMENKKIKSIHDWGLGSVFKYKKDKIERNIVGKYYAEDYYDAGCDCVSTREIDQPFKEPLAGYPIDIWLLDESVTIAIDTKHQYNYETSVVGGLMDGSTNDSSQAFNKVFAGTYDVYKEVEVTTTDKDGKKVTTTESVFDRSVDLYKYREGQIEETKPVPDLEKEKKLEEEEQAAYEKEHGEPYEMSRYAMDFADFYSIFRPEKVQLKLKFTDSMTSYNATLPLGEGVNTAKYQKAFQYFSIAQQLGNELGIDPYIIIAMVAQESGGNPNTSNGGGLMQVHNLLSFTSTVNTTDANGNPLTCSLTLSEASDPAKNMRFGSCYLKTKMDKFDGNVYKAIQSYNFDVSGYISKKYPDAWADNEGNSWMQYIEEARYYYGEKETGGATHSASYDCLPGLENKNGTRYGDSCYLPHVLQYYGNPNATNGGAIGDTNNEAGNSETSDKESEKDKDGGILSDLFESVWKKLKKDKYGVEVYNYDENQPHVWYEAKISQSNLADIFRLTDSFNQSVPMGEAKIDMKDKEFFLNEGNGRATSGSNLGNTVTGGDIQGVPSGAEGLIMPVNHPNPSSLITSGYGQRWGTLHAGIDFGIPIGTPLYAMADGKVERAINNCPKQGSLEGTGTCGSGILEWGNHIKLVLKNGDYIIYGHMNELAVGVGEVKQGQFLGTSGGSGFSSGPHLHLEYRVNGRPIDPSFILNTTTGK